MLLGRAGREEQGSCLGLVNQCAVLVSAVCGFCLDEGGEQSLSFSMYCIMYVSEVNI